MTICRTEYHREWRRKRFSDPELKEKERERALQKYHNNKEKYIAVGELYRKSHLKQAAEIQRRYNEKNKEKIKAHTLSKTIPLKPQCEICKSKEPLERHHWRYDKPLIFATLCNDCHKIQHHKRRLI